MSIGNAAPEEKSQKAPKLAECKHVWEFEDETIEHDISDDEYYVNAYYVHFVRCQTCGKAETMFSNRSYYDDEY